MKRLKTLVADDEKNIVRVLRAYLEAEGHDVVEAYDGAQALDVFVHERPDLVILDLMMPKISGETVCETIRKTSDVPIIMLTAKVLERQKIEGLDMGADDYVAKPFSPSELMARVRAVLRRRPNPVEGAVFDDGHLKVDAHSKRVLLEGKALAATGTEFDILLLFCTHPDRIFSREELIERVLGYDYDGYDRTIDAHIKNLRKKIGAHYIETVYGMGYRFKEVQAHEDDTL